MPKLNVSIDLEFKTGPVWSMPDAAKEIISNDHRDEILAQVPPEEYGFILRPINDGDVALDFEFFATDGKRNSEIQVSSRGDETGLIGRIRGDFAVSLRAGVAQRVKPLGDELDLRLIGLASKKLRSGVGFESMVDGYDDMTSWDYPGSFLFLPKISKFSLK